MYKITKQIILRCVVCALLILAAIVFIILMSVFQVDNSLINVILVIATFALFGIVVFIILKTLAPANHAAALKKEIRLLKTGRKCYYSSIKASSADEFFDSVYAKLKKKNIRIYLT